MSPPCTTCVPSCSLFPRSAGGKVMLPPLTPPHDCAMTNDHGWGQEASELLTTCSCHCKPLLRPEATGNYFNDHDLVLDQRRSMNTQSSDAINAPTPFSRQPQTTPIPFQHNRQSIPHPKTAAALSLPSSTDITTSSQASAQVEPVTSSVRTFRFKNTSTYGQNGNQRETKSPSHRLSPNNNDGSLKEINITRRARRQIYLKPDVEGSPFRLLMYVDCRSAEHPQEEGSWNSGSS